MTDPRLGLPSASSFAADVACPGRRQLLSSLPSTIDMPDEDSSRGTRIHDALMKESPADLQDESEIDDYTKGLKHIEDLCFEWSEQVGQFPTELPREERLWLNDKAMNPIISGQLDRHWRAGNSLLILDWKTGWNTYVPPAVKSWQLRLYAVLGYRNYDDITHVRVAFVKPKLKSDPIDFCDYTAQDLEDSEQAILYHLWACKQPDAPRIAGAHCRFCPAKGFCPESGAFTLLPSVLAQNPGSDSFAIEERVNALQPMDLVRIWQYKAVIGGILDAVTARLKAMTDEELASMGIKRSKPKQLDPIVNVKGAFERLKYEGIPEDALWKLMDISKTGIVTELRRQFGWPGDKALGWVKGLGLGEFIQEKKSKPGLEKA